MIQRLEDIRIRAVQHSTLEPITMLAAEIPLPLVSASEQIDLGDGSSGVVYSRMEAIPPQGGLGWEPWDGTEELPGGEQLEDGQDAFAIEGSWLELLYLAPDTEHAFEYFDLAIANEEGMGLAATLPLEDSTLPSHTGAPETLQSLTGEEGWAADGEAALGTSSEAAVQDSHVLLSPWAETFPGMLETYLDYLDRMSPSLRYPLASPDSVPSTDLELTHAAVNDASPPISTECLLTLQDGINKAYRCRGVMKDGLKKAQRASRCTPSR
ncbi:uncharacterized protein HRG_05141 [Hirsutella rhossiliensis]|uniref:Uncharacterized protein n=1 Tax=Hirsutella rhossiliensis TaxID=111463 RepID=A0A9P8SIY5_9HYPO|nr:uncharacterized protein HRG_05141 [Hirsutella rhossiliensis]KAH0964713.1 hypothetical protein HRG_05141 [Hirsutella rhossiliensis]